MKTKALLTTLLLAGLFAVSSTAMAAEVRTDKGDYAPGEVALIAGAGFFPNEPITLSISIDDLASGLHIGDWDWAEGYADGYGAFLTGYTVPEEAAGMALTATAMGYTSGLVASATFTDGPANKLQVTITSVSGTPITSLPATISITFNYNFSGGAPEGTTSAHGEVLASPTIAGSSKTVSNSGGSATVDVAVPVGTANGPYNTKVLVSNSVLGSSGDGQEVGNPANGFAVSVNVPTPPTNHPPVIMALNPTAELGQVVGCLGTGSGFGRAFSVSYAAAPVSGSNSWVVRATFTVPTLPPTTVTVDVANVTDADALDTITVTLGSGTNPVTISGPGLGSASFSVAVTASDGKVTVGPTTCTGTVEAQIIYAFVGFLRPLDNAVATIVKRGSTVPVKFQLFDCSGNPITTGDHMIDVTFLSGTAPYGVPTVDDAGTSGDDDVYFRYSAPNWIFNLKTNTSYGLGDSYTILANLDDGTSHTVVISIK